MDTLVNNPPGAWSPTDLQRLKMDNINLARALQRERIMCSNLVLAELDRQEAMLQAEIGAAPKE